MSGRLQDAHVEAFIGVKCGELLEKMAAVARSGGWLKLRCDVCGTTFDGFHVLNEDRDRCCPDCAGGR
jgi:hypothetical protein